MCKRKHTSTSFINQCVVQRIALTIWIAVYSCFMHQCAVQRISPVIWIAVWLKMVDSNVVNIDVCVTDDDGWAKLHVQLIMFMFTFVFTASVFCAHPTGTWVDRIFSQVHAWRRTFCADMVHCNELSEMQMIHAWRKSLCAFLWRLMAWSCLIY